MTLSRAFPILVVMAGALLAAGPSTARAQTILGRVLERGGGGPVTGAMVRLSTDGGPLGGGWLTAADGRYRLQAPAGGRYDVTVERIGFGATVVRDVEVASGGIASVDLVVETEAIALEGLDVEAQGGRCEIDPSGGAAQVLWDEARKALSAATWTEREVRLRFEITAWDRQIDPRTSQVLVEQLDQREAFGANSVQSLPPDRLVRDGYVRQDPAFTYYYAPDAEVLLSDEFQSTHCFRVVEEEVDGSPWLGLEFEPDDDRELPDVEGVIWVDPLSARLDRVDFRYTNLDVPGANRARGQVRFAELDNGQWIVRDWFIQAPMPRGLLGTPGGLRRGGRAQIHEVGNSVALAMGDGVAWYPDVASGVVRGTVYDSISGAPLAGAEVRLAGRNVRGVADLAGRFELDGVRPGLHRVTFGHHRLDSLGVTPGWARVELEPGGHVSVELAVPPWTTLLAASCPAGREGALVGTVRTRNGSLAGGVTVEATGAGILPGSPVTDTSDQFGGFVLCDLPDQGVVRLVARLDGAESDVVETRTSATDFVQTDLTLRPVEQPVAIPGALRPALVGTVMDHDSRTPIEDVTVTLLDPDGDVIAVALTDSDGAFGLVLDRGAEVHISVSRLGYTGAISEALDLSEGTRRVEILLPPEAIQLDPVLVQVEGRLPQLERVGFYQRAVSVPGIFIRQDDVEAVAPARTSDLLGRAPGVRVTTDPQRGDPRRRVLFNRLALMGGDRCYPSLFVDDELVRMGGSRTESQAPVIQGIEPPAGEDVPSIDELVPPHEIEAVEMYENAAQVPQRFIGLGTHCGVIVIWTTRRR